MRKPTKLICICPGRRKPIWEHSGKYYLKINAVKVKELPVETCFNKAVESVAEIRGDDESTRKLHRKISKSWLVKFPTLPKVSSHDLNSQQQ